MTTARHLTCTYEELQDYLASMTNQEDPPSPEVAILWCDPGNAPEGTAPAQLIARKDRHNGLVKDVLDWLTQPDLLRR